MDTDRFSKTSSGKNQPRGVTLSPKERSVALMLQQGYSSAEAATFLKMSTVMVGKASNAIRHYYCLPLRVRLDWKKVLKGIDL